jgi:hypothetical protein
MFGRGGIPITIAACALAAPVAEQAPAPTTKAFDGKYVGTATIGRDRATTTCWAIDSMNMTITGGQVVIYAIGSTGNEPTLRGSVNTAGEVLASLQGYKYFHSISGTIHDKVFTGQRMIGLCYWSVQMQIAPPPTMPFDGDYVGVSRESSCLANGVPVTLIIRNSVVIGGTWQGNVNPQGVVVMGNRLAPRVDGQVDKQGIRAQGSSSDGRCTVTFVWRKQSS